MRISMIALVWAMAGASAVAEEAPLNPPVLHGYGGRGCDQFLAAERASDAGDEDAALDHFGYQQWLAGLASGLSLASGGDVLRGGDVEGMMRRMQRTCEDDPGLDVFSAALVHIRDLSVLQ